MNCRFTGGDFLLCFRFNFLAGEGKKASDRCNDSSYLVAVTDRLGGDLVDLVGKVCSRILTVGQRC